MDDDGGIGAEVSNRLDELFGDDDDTQPGAPLKKAEASPKTATASADGISPEEKAAAGTGGDSPVKELKALVFGIDWEITDESMIAFLREVKRLQKKYQSDKINLLFLKLHESIGKYIRARKANAHPDALKFVTSVFNSFEKVLTTPGMSEIQKKRILSGEVKKFKDFKARVISREHAVAAPAAGTEAVSEGPLGAKTGPAMPLGSREAVEYIIEELKKTIREEFAALRQMLK